MGGVCSHALDSPRSDSLWTPHLTELHRKGSHVSGDLREPGRTRESNAGAIRVSWTVHVMYHPEYVWSGS